MPDCSHAGQSHDVQHWRGGDGGGWEGSSTWSGGSLHGVGALLGTPHGILELLVHSGEGLGLVRQLALDVGRCEDGLQVHPLLLAGHPLI